MPFAQVRNENCGKNELYLTIPSLLWGQLVLESQHIVMEVSCKLIGVEVEEADGFTLQCSSLWAL
jgi:hypothetical protein